MLSSQGYSFEKSQYLLTLIMFLKLKNIVYSGCAKMQLAKKALKKCSFMSMVELFQRLVCKFFIFFGACTQLYIQIVFAVNKHVFPYLCDCYSRISVCEYLTQVFSVVFFCQQYSIQEDAKCMEGKGAVRGNKQQVQRSVREEIKPEATGSGGN